MLRREKPLFIVDSFFFLIKEILDLGAWENGSWWINIGLDKKFVRVFRKMLEKNSNDLFG